MQLSGEIAKVNLPNLLQLVKTGGFSGKLALSQGVRYASVIITEGSPSHVELEGATGLDALLELFLWKNGTFAFNEETIEDSKVSIKPDLDLADIIKDGMLYVKQKEFLEEMGVSPDSVLRPTGTAVSTAQLLRNVDSIKLLDGEKTLKQALAGLKLSRREYVRTVAEWLENGLAEFAEPVQGESGGINLPPWVIARLKQDNGDITQAIVDMVIWVDRVKCWMYQADAEFHATRRTLAALSENLGEETFTAEAFPDEENEAESHEFAPPQPSPEDKSDSRYDTIFDTSSFQGKKDNSNQFRLSSSFIGGAGGKRSILGSTGLGSSSGSSVFGSNLGANINSKPDNYGTTNQRAENQKRLRKRSGKDEIDPSRD